MDKNENKVNRYTTLRDEVLGLSAQKKQKKTEYVNACKEALAAYRKWVNDVYKPGKKAALDKFAASKRVAKPKVEKQPKAKKVVVKKDVKLATKLTKVDGTAAEGIAKGEAVIAKAKAAAAKNPKSK